MALLSTAGSWLLPECVEYCRQGCRRWTQARNWQRLSTGRPFETERVRAGGPDPGRTPPGHPLRSRIFPVDDRARPLLPPATPVPHPNVTPLSTISPPMSGGPGCPGRVVLPGQYSVSRSRSPNGSPPGPRRLVPRRDRRSKARGIVNPLAHLETRQIHRITEEVIDRATEPTTGELGAMQRRRAIAVDPEPAEKRYRKRTRRPAGHPRSEQRWHCQHHRSQPRGPHRRPDNETDLRPRRDRQNRHRPQNHRPGPRRCLRRSPNPPPHRLSAGNGAERCCRHQSRSHHARWSQREPGEVPGRGPVVSDIARGAAEPGKPWQVTVTDSAGRPAWRGITRRRPNIPERRQVTATIPTCVFSGYRMPSTQCDIDHHHPWAEGCQTEPENLGPGCRLAHILKTTGGWRLRVIRTEATRGPAATATPTTPDPNHRELRWAGAVTNRPGPSPHKTRWRLLQARRAGIS